MLGRVLIIAGSDSGGGAGIQGDIKTVTCLGGYAATAITALTAQNTCGVFGISEVPDAFITQQISLVMEDIGTDAFKTGMLHKKSVIEVVAAAIMPHVAHVPFVLDPVMFAKGGHPLLEVSATETLKKTLLPLAHIITPNIPEAEHLSGIKILSVDDMKRAAEKILALGCKAVLLKGGHMESEEMSDVLLSDNGFDVFTSARIDTKSTHGTGCTIASAIATGLAQKLSLKDAVSRARAYVRKAIETAPQIGHGHGPLNHGHTIKEF
ncbi:MAG: bifunctional hydroxymethylpyrimidine kinase/phosphomethylpyrimidine kinase [Alphaproteobacteria bacterium]|nr:bifunctional hydroxymethylpyrimidine kinase/phosphomethylpyrimidine kinase [Alphaproteobacteria bacterium]